MNAHSEMKRLMHRGASCFGLMMLGLIGMSLDLHAQPTEQQIEFEYLSPGPGLAQNTILCITQDQKGFLWIGTEDGLVRYDGYDFTVYRHDPENPRSLSHNVVQAIYEDRAGQFWVGTRGAGLNLFDRATDTFLRYRPETDDAETLSHNNISVIYEDRLGTLWIGTNGGGLDTFDRAAKTFSNYGRDAGDSGSISSNFIRSIYEDRSGELWIGTLGGGLNRFNRPAERGNSGTFSQYRHDPHNPHSLSHDSISAIYEDHLGTFWIGTQGGGLNRFDRTAQQFFSYTRDSAQPQSLSHNKVRAVYEDRSGELWIGTEGGGLNRFDRETGQFSHYQAGSDDSGKLSLNIVTALYEDRTGILWIGTEGGGLNKVTRRRAQLPHYSITAADPRQQASNVILSLYEDRNGRLWIGTYGGGLCQYDRASRQLTHYRFDPDNPQSLNSDVVLSLYEDRSGVLWIGTKDGGLNTLVLSPGSGQAPDKAAGLTPERAQFSRYRHDPDDPRSLSHDRVRTIYADRAGTLWIGTEGGGLNRLAPESEQGAPKSFIHYRHDPDDPQSLGHDAVWSIYEDHLGTLWIGTDGGLDAFDRDTGQFFHYYPDSPDLRNVSNNHVRSMYEDRSGTFWISTRRGGLKKFDRASATFSHYGKKDGLPDDVIYGILEDRPGNLWLSTAKHGLVKFDPQTASSQQFDVSNGLQSHVFNIGAYHKSRSGEMFFGGINGFNAFYPDTIRENPHIPPIVITDFQLFHTSVEIGNDSPLRTVISETQALTLSYTENTVSFKFAALDYTHPEKNQYAYMLEGGDRDWVPAGTERLVTYGNLAPGKYVFRVKGTNNAGVWNDAGASVRLILFPPLWATWWFRLSVGIVVIGGIIGVFGVRVKVIERQKHILERQVRDRTAELEIQKKLAETANRTKSQFLAKMSHDLRTPLNGILGYAQILKRDPATPGHQQNGLAVIEHSGNHLLTLINDVLDLAQVESGVIELYTTDFHLPVLLRTVADLMRIRAERKGIHLHLKMADTLPAYVHGDERRLRQVLLNLLDNAIKFTDKGSITLRILDLGFEILDCKALESASSHQKSHIKNLKFEISDTGVGMTPEELERIFDPFQQAGTHERRAAGTGLGLAISRNLVELMGGRLQVSSVVGEGSRFWFEMALPVAQVDASGTVPPTQRILGIRRCAHCRGDAPKVLVVDDNWENRSVVVDLLRPLGFRMAEAANGLVGVEQAAAWQPDLVMTDLVMPELDGFELIRHLRQSPASAQIKILAASASVYEDDHRKSLVIGADAFLPKPLDSERLFEEIERLLGIEWHYAEDEAPPETGTFALPPVEDVQKILTLTKMRDIDAIQQALHNVHETDAAFQPFARQASRLVETFQLNKLKALLEEYLQQ